MPEEPRFAFTDLPDGERPRERLLQQGAGGLSNAELLALVLGTGTKHENVLQFAQRIFAHFGGWQGLARISAAELRQVKGLGDARSSQILATIEIAKRLNKATVEVQPVVKSTADAAQLVSDMAHLHQEQVRVILLNTHQQVIAIPTVYMGTVNASMIRVAEIYREAILRNSPAVILAHNHPSGDPTPSPEDVELTRILRSAGKLLDIQLLDHLIIAQRGWLSLRDMGLGFRD
jgi:DNA repair protein RadC